MEPIIRAAAVAAAPRLLRRGADAHAAPAPAALASAGAGAAPAAPAGSPAARPPAMPAAAPDAALPQAQDMQHAASAPVAAGAASLPLQWQEQQAQLQEQQARLQEQQEQWRQQQAQWQEQQALLQEQQALLQEQQARVLEQQEQLAAARRQLDDECATALDSAAQRGHAQGLAQGADAARAQAEAQLERVNALVRALQQARQALLAGQEDLLVEIAFTAVCRVFGEQAAGAAGVAAMVQQMVGAARAPEQLCVRLHPADLALLTGPDGLAGHGLDPALALRADAGIALGGCLVDGPRGTLDARLEWQVEQLRQALLATRRQRATAEAAL